MSVHPGLTLETPSRIWRRVQDGEGQDLPSLPELSELDLSDNDLQSSPMKPAAFSMPADDSGTSSDNDGQLVPPVQSTPTVASRRSSQGNSQSRFAQSILSRSGGHTTMGLSTKSVLTTKTPGTVRFAPEHESFEISEILPLDTDEDLTGAYNSKIATDNDYDDSLRAALAPLSRSPSPEAHAELDRQTPTRKYDYSVSLRTESRPTGVDSVSVRKPSLTRTRTPPLSHSPISQSSSSSTSTNDTPDSIDISLPTPRRSRNANSSPPPTVVTRVEQPTATPSSTNETEPTISDEVETAQPSRVSEMLSAAFASPVVSEIHPGEPTYDSYSPTTFTPSPAELPQRKPVPTIKDTLKTPGPVGAMVDDALTPHARRRSFLLSIVNSTARPRMAVPTPRPRHSLHPLSQVYTPESGDRNSFISTASSHDLTVHPRANASFDPTTGSKGVGKFNATKLNTYLHGLNRRLADENRALIQRLVAYEGDEAGMAGVSISQTPRGVAAGDLTANRSGATAALDRTLREDVVRSADHRARLETELAQVKEERARDKERWVERMTEVEKGVEAIVKGLENQVANADRGRVAAVNKAKELEAGLEELKERAAAGRDEAAERIKQAESALGDTSNIGNQFKEASERTATFREQLQDANNHIHDLQKERDDAIRRADTLAAESNAAAETIIDLETQLEEIQPVVARVAELEEQEGILDEELGQLHEQLTQANARIALLEEELNELDAEATSAKTASERAVQQTENMEEALEQAEQATLADKEEIDSLRARVATLERQVQRHPRTDVSGPAMPLDETHIEIEQLEVELDQAHRDIARLNHLLADSPARKALGNAKDARIDLLEQEKEELLERIKELRGTTQTNMTFTATPAKIGGSAFATPARGSEAELSAAVNRAVLALKTPRTPGAPLPDLSWLNETNAHHTTVLSPLVHQIAHLERQLAQANESIDAKIDQLGEAGLSAINVTKRLEQARAEISQLKAEIGRLTRREGRRVQRMRRMRCKKCAGVFDLGELSGGDGDESSVEVSTYTLPSNPPTPESKTTVTLKKALEAVNAELVALKTQWRQDKTENGVLKDATRRLNTDLGPARRETRGTVQEELDAARKAVADLEEELKGERRSLRSLTSDQNRTSSEKKDLLAQLHRAQSDMDEVKAQMQAIKQENHELERELRVNTVVDQKARHLENRVSENLAEMERLRDDKALLSTELVDLRRRFTQVSEHVDKLAQQLCDSQAMHEGRRHDLDVRINEIESLRQTLATQNAQLKRAASERKLMTAEREGVAQTVAALEAKLRAVKREAESFGRDLRLLQVEREQWEAKARDDSNKYERTIKQNQTRLRLAHEQLETQKERLELANAELNSHVCATDDQSLVKLRLQHKKECKGLMVQIHYLKAKFTREATLRADLGYQKRYLLLLLGVIENNEKRVLACVARIGFPRPVSKPRSRHRTFKTIAVSVLFTVRARRAAKVWQEQSAAKKAVALALQEVRSRRITAS